MKNMEERHQFTEDFYILYLNGSASELEVNIPRAEAGKIEKKLRSQKNETKDDEIKLDENMNETLGETLLSGSDLPDDLLDEIEKNIMTNTSDTFARFSLTSHYLK
jgi:hypothetical protein